MEFIVVYSLAFSFVCAFCWYKIICSKERAINWKCIFAIYCWTAIVVAVISIPISGILVLHIASFLSYTDTLKLITILCCKNFALLFLSAMAYFNVLVMCVVIFCPYLSSVRRCPCPKDVRLPENAERDGESGREMSGE